MSVLKRSGLLFAIFLLPVFLGSAAAQQNGKGDPAKGKQLFQDNGCFRCHTTDSPVVKRGPSLMGIFQRPPHALGDGTRHEKHTDEMIRAIITQGTNKGMPPRGIALSDQELDDLLAYLHSL